MRKEKRVSLLYRAATTNYPCCGQALGGSKGADRIGLTRAQKYYNFTKLQIFFLKKGIKG